MLPLSRLGLFLGAVGVRGRAGGGSAVRSAAAAWAQQDDNARLRAFTHPGVADLARMKAAVAAQESPVYDGRPAFHARSKYTYAVQNTGQITYGPRPHLFPEPGRRRLGRRLPERPDVVRDR